MGKCYFCEERERTSYWSNWCEDCANLRRMLLLYNPKKCTDILKRTLTRDDKQIDYKINQEVKKIVLNELPTIKETNDDRLNPDAECYEKKLRPRNNKK